MQMRTGGTLVARPRLPNRDPRNGATAEQATRIAPATQAPRSSELHAGRSPLAHLQPLINHAVDNLAKTLAIVPEKWQLRVRGPGNKGSGAAREVSMGPREIHEIDRTNTDIGVIARLADHNSGGRANDTIPPRDGEDFYSRALGWIAAGWLEGISLAQFPSVFQANPGSQGYLILRPWFQGSNKGSPAKLVQVNTELLRRGIAPVADLVLNHAVAATHDELKDGPYTYKPSDRIYGLNSNAVYASRGGTGPLRKATPDALELFPGPAELNQDNPKVRRVCGDKLVARASAAGFCAARFDFAHGMSPGAIADYVDTHAITGISEFWYGCHATINNPAENLYTPAVHREKLSQKARDSHTVAYDFTTMWALREAFKAVSTGPNGETDVDFGKSDLRRLVDKAGGPAGLIGIDPEHAVLVVENHDTGPSTNRFNENHPLAHGQQHWPMPGWAVGLGYAYALTHPAAGAEVYAPHLFDWMSHGAGPHKGKRMGEEIRILVRLRNAAGIGGRSRVTILRAEKGLYVAKIEGTAQTLYVKLGWDSWTPSSQGFQAAYLSAHGLHYAVWSAPSERSVLASTYASSLH